MHATTILRGAIARTGLKSYPLSVTYELTWLCNLECTYCDRHTPMANELSRGQIFKALAEFHELGMRDLSLDGGEPLAHPHVDDIVQWTAERDITISLNSNGILVPRKIDTVRRLSKLIISLDGPRESHDAMRGIGSFEKAVAGAHAARNVGVPVEFTCIVGSHNAHSVEQLLETAEALGVSVVFQPALNSLFQGSSRDGSGWLLNTSRIRTSFAHIEGLKRRGRAVGNGWSSLRHFHHFPEETRPPCAAGWIMCTMDPEGVLFSCGQLDRSDRSNNVTQLGAAQAFANLRKIGCGECWCARLVEDNYKWGCRVDKMLPPLPSGQR